MHFPHLGTEGVCNWKTSGGSALFRPKRPDPQPIREELSCAHSITNPSPRIPWGSRNLHWNLSLHPAWSGLPRPDLLYSQLLPYAQFPQLAPRCPLNNGLPWPALPTEGLPRLEKCETTLPRHLFWSITPGELQKHHPVFQVFPNSEEQHIKARSALPYEREREGIAILRSKSAGTIPS